MVKAVVGANWGDECKGKITDMLAEKADFVVRFQGGANAGHTIVNKYGKFALHTLPSGIFYDHTTSIIGNGVALDIPVFCKEIQTVVEQGAPMPKILVSNRAQIVMPYHVLFDQYEEERLGKKSFGSTKSGIAPFYSDKYAKIGFQVSELFDDERLLEKVESVVEKKNILLEHMYHKPLLSVEELMNTLRKYRDMIAPYVADTSVVLHNAIKEDKVILLEGQLGTLKDPDHGIYPMVTSSSTLAAYGAIGAGIPPYEIKEVITVCKAYSSAVGAGAFVSEIFGDEADELRRRGGDGGEYGATTGRPRRMGWFDCVASKYGCRMQGTTGVAFTVFRRHGIASHFQSEIIASPFARNILPSDDVLDRLDRDASRHDTENRNPRLLFRRRYVLLRHAEEIRDSTQSFSFRREFSMLPAKDSLRRNAEALGEFLLSQSGRQP